MFSQDRIRARMPEMEEVRPIRYEPEEVVLQSDFVRPYIATGEEASTVGSFSEDVCWWNIIILLKFNNEVRF